MVTKAGGQVSEQARLSGSRQGQIINRQLVDGSGQGCLTTLLGGTVTEERGPQGAAISLDSQDDFAPEVNALSSWWTGLVPQLFGKLVEVKIQKTGKDLTHAKQGSPPQWGVPPSVTLLWDTVGGDGWLGGWL